MYNFIKILLIFLSILFIPAALLNYGYNSDLENMFLMSIQSIILILLVILSSIIMLKRRQGLNLSYLLYLFLTHFGIFIVQIVQEQPFVNTDAPKDWYYFNTIELYLLSSFSIYVFLIFSLLLYNKSNVIKLEGNKVLLILGYIIVLSFTVVYLYWMLTGQINLSLSYNELHRSLGNIPHYGTAIFLFSVGIVFILSNANVNDMKKPLLFLVVPILLLLLLGNRGEVFYPLLAGVGVLIVRGYNIKARHFIIAGLIFFLVFPVIKQTRNIDELDINEIQIDYTSSILEVGYTARPLAYTILWDQIGEEKGYGISYFVATQRQLANVMPFEKISYEGKPYNFRERIPNMGFSVVGEAYYNFSYLGPPVIFLIICGFIYFISSFKSVYWITFGGGVFAILINNIRNAFSFVPGQVIGLAILIITAYLIDKWIKRRSKNVIPKKN